MSRRSKILMPHNLERRQDIKLERNLDLSAFFLFMHTYLHLFNQLSWKFYLAVKPELLKWPDDYSLALVFLYCIP